MKRIITEQQINQLIENIKDLPYARIAPVVNFLANLPKLEQSECEKETKEKNCHDEIR